MDLLTSLKGKKIYSILTGTCPVCQEDKMYYNPNPYNISTIFKMQEKCSNCQTKYKMEPSFFFGAMYVSYGLGIALALPVFLVVYFLFHISLLGSFIFIVIALAIFMPVIARLARNIWINLFMNYNEKYEKTRKL